MKIANAHQTYEMDLQTIRDLEVPGLILMENAAQEFIKVLKTRFGSLENKKIVVVCGKGNNGGDGLAIARHLSQRDKAQVQILLSNEADEFKGDALKNYKMAQNYKLKIQSAKDNPFENCEMIIDALFGTGFKGQVDVSTSKLIEKINKSNKTVIAVDIPSGLEADSGNLSNAVIKASLTITFSLAKYGLLIYPAAEYVGDLVVVDIGIPDFIIESQKINLYTIETSDVKQFLPRRKNKRDTNKSSYGHVIVFAGSSGFSGAAVLTAEASQRAGAGLVTLSIPEGIEKQIVAKLSSVIMTRSLSQARDSSFSAHALSEALALIHSATVAALGPGIGLGEEVADFVAKFVAQCPTPLVVDADALTLMSQISDRGASIIKNRKAATILTPHPAELARLLGITTSEVQNNRLLAIKKAVQVFGCVVLLKGSRTLISDTSENIYMNMTGNPGLSSGGCGDVLTGIISGFLAQNLDALGATISAAYVHGLAADLVECELGTSTGTNATDLISYLPQSIAHCQK